MAEDRRITRTKRTLKDTLRALLAERPLDEITVKDLCAASGVSRITFYTHYEDKYDLLSELFGELAGKADARFRARQKENNPGLDGQASCGNLLDSMIDFYFEAANMFILTTAQDDPAVQFLLCRCVLETVEEIVSRDRLPLSPQIGLRKAIWFICYGLLGLFHAQDVGAAVDLEPMRAEARILLRELMRLRQLQP